MCGWRGWRCGGLCGCERNATWRDPPQGALRWRHGRPRAPPPPPPSQSQSLDRDTGRGAGAGEEAREGGEGGRRVISRAAAKAVTGGWEREGGGRAGAHMAVGGRFAARKGERQLERNRPAPQRGTPPRQAHPWGRAGAVGGTGSGMGMWAEAQARGRGQTRGRRCRPDQGRGVKKRGRGWGRGGA